MLLRICLAFVIATVTSAHTYGISTVNGKIKITVVTTAGCEDTMRFINKQLNPVYNKFSKYLNVEFVPWGGTRRSRDGELVCKFGAEDCFANRVQRCTLYLFKGDKKIQMKYMACEFKLRSAFKKGDLTCARKVGVNLGDLETCISTRKGDHLDIIHEAKAAEPMRLINFVPAIVFNDRIDQDVQKTARTNLKSLICGALRTTISRVPGC